MNTRIIVGYDGTKGANAALAWATVEAGKDRGAPMQIVSCYDLPNMGGVSNGVGDADLFRRLLDDAKKCADEGRELTLAEHPDLTVDTTVCPGPAWLELLDLGFQHDLIVVGASERYGARAAVLGSTPRRVAHHAGCPVVVVREDATCSHLRTRVVVGVDDSADATAATRWAAEEADRFGVELVVAHIWNYPYAVADRASGEARDVMRVDAARVLDRAVELARDITGSPVSGALIEAPSIAGLIDVVREGDLLVLGSRGRRRGAIGTLRVDGQQHDRAQSGLGRGRSPRRSPVSVPISRGEGHHGAITTIS